MDRWMDDTGFDQVALFHYELFTQLYCTDVQFDGTV
jgi:hypothetical protein